MVRYLEARAQRERLQHRAADGRRKRLDDLANGSAVGLLPGRPPEVFLQLLEVAFNSKKIGCSSSADLGSFGLFEVIRRLFWRFQSCRTVGSIGAVGPATSTTSCSTPNDLREIISICCRLGVVQLGTQFLRNGLVLALAISQAHALRSDAVRGAGAARARSARFVGSCRNVLQNVALMGRPKDLMGGGAAAPCLGEHLVEPIRRVWMHQPAASQGCVVVTKRSRPAKLVGPVFLHSARADGPDKSRFALGSF